MATDDGKILDLLAADGALTADQARRVRAQVGRGKPLAEALQSTPLVDPLQLAKAQQKAADANPVLGAAARSNMAEHALASVESSDEETINEMLKKSPEVRRPKIPALDGDPKPAAPAADAPRRPKIPSLDPEPKPAAPAAGEPPRRPKIPSLDPQPKAAPAPAAEAPKGPMNAADWDRRLQEAMRARQGGAEAPAAEPAKTAASSPNTPPGGNRRLELPGSPESFLRPESAKLKYDLANDEGINLIKELNGLLVELVDMEGRGIEIDGGAKDGEVRFFSGSGALSMQRKLDGDRAMKLINRLKVMARIEPWRKDSPKGAFEIRHFAARRMVHLQITSRGQDAEVAVCYLIQG